MHLTGFSPGGYLRGLISRGLSPYTRCLVAANGGGELAQVGHSAFCENLGERKKQENWSVFIYILVDLLNTLLMVLYWIFLVRVLAPVFLGVESAPPPGTMKRKVVQTGQQNCLVRISLDAYDMWLYLVACLLCWLFISMVMLRSGWLMVVHT